MKQITTLAIFIAGLSIGVVAGHYHGKAEVYSGMFEANAKMLEALK